VSGYEGVAPTLITIPWETRRGMRWPHINVYSPVTRHGMSREIPSSTKYEVPIPIDLIDMPYTTYRIRSGRGQVSAQSRYTPPVRVEGITYEELGQRLSMCDAANVRHDKVFAGQDIRVLVRPYDYQGPDVRGTGLSLLEVTLIASPDDGWYPIPLID
jgi:hypothetical protein